MEQEDEPKVDVTYNEIDAAPGVLLNAFSDDEDSDADLDTF